MVPAVVRAPRLRQDPVRTDGHVLQQYLAVRKVSSWVLGRREAAGMGGLQAQANKPIFEKFAFHVVKLSATNTMFQDPGKCCALPRQRDHSLLIAVRATTSGSRARP